jgi:hypothetical protein
MKRLVFLICALICLVITGCDEKGAWEGDYTIRDMNDMRALAGYTSVTGDLIIQPESPVEDIFGGIVQLMSSLTNLSSLTSLTSIGGDLVIYGNPFLTSIDGLKNLESVGGSITIEYNFSLGSLDCFQKIPTLPGSLKIYANDKIKDLKMFEGLTSIEGNLYISGNEKLSDIGLQALQGVAGDLTITNNESLPASQAEQFRERLLAAGGIGGTITINDNFDDSYPGKVYRGDYTIYRESDINELEGVGYITGSLYVKTATYYNPFGDFIKDQSLDSLKGLESLTRIGGSLEILDKENLKSMDGLNNLKIIESGLTIYKNGLTSLDGLESLSYVGGSFSVTSNKSLPESNAVALKDQVIARDGIGGNITIQNNLIE